MASRFSVCTAVYQKAFEALHPDMAHLSPAVGVAVAKAIAILKNARMHRSADSDTSRKKRKVYMYKSGSEQSSPETPLPFFQIDRFYIVPKNNQVLVYLSEPKDEVTPLCFGTVDEGIRQLGRVPTEILSAIDEFVANISSFKRIYDIYHRIKIDFNL